MLVIWMQVLLLICILVNNIFVGVRNLGNTKVEIVMELTVHNCP